MTRPVRKLLLATLFGSALAGPAFAGAAPDYEDVVAGRYQAILADCMGCHTSPGGKAFAGGAPLQTPFGKIVPPNITPDEGTGIGNWSKQDFRRAVKQGIGPDGQELLYPAMPYPAYARMSDADVDHIWSYMQTVDPVRRASPSNMLAWPFDIRSLMAVWNRLYFKPVSATPQPDKSAAWNHGAYLVTGPGHCGTCHTPKTLLGGDTPAALKGASLAGWFAPDITSGSKGVGRWSVGDVVAYLKTGHNAHSMASGPMAEAIEYSTSKMTDTDLNAIAVYLKDAPASAGGPEGGAVAKNNSRMKAGSAIYADNCQGCHNRDGSGQNAIFPPFAGNPIVSQSSAETLVRVVLAGTQGADTPSAPTTPAMPSFAWRLNDAQIADVLTYVRSNWGDAGPVSPGTVAQIRAAN